jgi:hypothetical protein
MKLTIKKQMLILGVLTVGGLTACSSGKQDDESMEMKEPVEAAPAEPGAPEAKPSSSVAAPQEPAAVAAPAPMPSVGPVMNTSRRVMYVKVDGAVLREKAEAKAKIVGKLEKGDHLLVTLEGDWAKTDDGKFISAKVLSEKGVGRGKKDASWSGGTKQDPATKKSEPVKTDDAKAAPAKNDVKKDAKKTAKPDAAKPGAAKPEAAKAGAAKPEAASGDEDTQP